MKKKHEIDEVDEILPEYDFSKGERGRYVKRCTQGIKYSISNNKRSSKRTGVVGYSSRISGRIVHSDVSSKSSKSGRVTLGRNEKTSKAVGAKASKLLRSKKTSKTVKSVAGSALTQRPDKKKKK